MAWARTKRKIFKVNISINKHTFFAPRFFYILDHIIYSTTLFSVSKQETFIITSFCFDDTYTTWHMSRHNKWKQNFFRTSVFEKFHIRASSKFRVWSKNRSLIIVFKSQIQDLWFKFKIDWFKKKIDWFSAFRLSQSASYLCAINFFGTST